MTYCAVVYNECFLDLLEHGPWPLLVAMGCFTLTKGGICMRMILLGPPGAGKGSQAKNLSNKLAIPHISTGDIFRANIQNKTELGQKVGKIIDEGGLVPDDLTVHIVEDRLLQTDCESGFILDGFPRTIPQAEQLDQLLKEKGKELNFVINLTCPDEAIIKRISGRRMCSCGRTYHLKSNPPRVDGKCDADGLSLYIREDDNEDTVKSRLATYHKQTEPLIAYYANKGIVRDIDGMNDINLITEIILKMLRKSGIHDYN